VNLNAALLLVARVVSALTTLALLVFLARARGGEELGLVSVGLAIGGWLAAVADAGTGSLLVRDAARDPSRTGALLGGFTVWRLVSLPLAVAVLWLVLLAVYPDRPFAILLPAAGLVVQQFAELTRAVFVARQQMLVSSLHSIVENVAWVTVLVASLAAGASLEVAFTVALAVFALSVVAGFALVAVVGRIRPSLPSMPERRDVVRRVAPFAAFGILGIAYTRIDTVLVAAFVPREGLVAAGADVAATRLVAAFEYLPETLSRSIYPELSRTFVSEPGRVAALLRPAARFLLGVGVPIPFALLVAGDDAMALLLGNEYATYGWLLVALAIVVPVRYLGYLFGMTLTGTDAQGKRVLAVSLALLLTVTLNAALLPRIGIVAAVIVTVLSAVLISAIYLRDVVGRFGNPQLGRPLGLTVGAASVAALVALAARPAAGDLGAVAVFLVAYAVLYGLTGGFPVAPRLERTGLHRQPPA
jgi:O-antigen/teichoic acid export membrane protein